MSSALVIVAGLLVFAFARSVKSLLLVSAVLVAIVGADYLWPDVFSSCFAHSRRCVASSFERSAHQTSSFLVWILRQAGIG